MKLWTVVVSIGLLSSMSLFCLDASSDPTARVESGELRGRLIDGGGASFKGIPFAQPPVGDLRWREPAPVPAWSGVRDATAYGPACTQEGSGANKQAAEDSKEDCLYLNVWASEWPSKSPKPVMVWLYGGNNMGGAASFNGYDGAALSRRGVIVVTINYRTGIFGFFTHPGLTAESPHHSSGNYGLLDQLAAVKWVHDNIAKFGGDPNRVTLFGQSSGSIDTSYLVASPLIRGLVQRAIEESGPPVRPIDPLADDEKAGVKFASFLGAPDDPAAAVKFLRSLSSSAIEKAAVAKFALEAVPLQMPVIDGYLVTEYPALIYKDGQDPSIPTIIGNNAQETSRNYKPAIIKKWIKDNYGSYTSEAEQFYGWSGDGTGHSDPFWGPTHIEIRADVRDRCPAIAQSIWRSDHNHTTYEYMFDLPMPGESVTKHGAEIPFVFGNLPQNQNSGGPDAEEDKKISDLLQTYWTNFAKTGDPNGKGLPEWPKFNAASRPYLEIKVHDGPVVQESLRKNICDMYIDALKETIPSNTAGDFPE